MANSELAYLSGITLAGLVSYFWMLRCLLELCRLPGDNSARYEDAALMMVLFLAVKVVLLMLHIMMLLFGWSGLTTGWFVGVGILVCDVCTIVVAYYARKWTLYRKESLEVAVQKQEKDNRKNVLEKLPRLIYGDLQVSSHSSERTPSTVESNMVLQDQCIVCLGNFEPDDEVIQLGCGHVFHEGCIADWFLNEKHDPCPFRCERAGMCETFVSRNRLSEELPEEDLDLEAALDGTGPDATAEPEAGRHSPVRRESL
ncbi:RNF128 [Symbiodinium pilosum]|uniref:RNF128 protein n=1 Tax=Symbiodinium pilosum TaxID=2952 RepID=A0A812V513_SYMPI|nr:RNF128 [Symbiodinium pilosum]